MPSGWHIIRMLLFASDCLFGFGLKCIGEDSDCVLKTPSTPWERKDFVQSPSVRRFAVSFGDAKARGCLGNVVTREVIVQKDESTTVHFGILKNGSMFVGYPNRENLKDFRHLVGGALWLIRAGYPNWDRAASTEDGRVQETGSWPEFINILSARASIGWDKRGRVIIAAVDGKTGSDGVNIPGIARIMMYFGAEEAINLDGGSTVTLVVNGTVVNSPSEAAPKNQQNQQTWLELTEERAVSTVLCLKHANI